MWSQASWANAKSICICSQNDFGTQTRAHAEMHVGVQTSCGARQAGAEVDDFRLRYNVAQGSQGAVALCNADALNAGPHACTCRTHGDRWGCVLRLLQRVLCLRRLQQDAECGGQVRGW